MASRPVRRARASPTVVLPLPGMPMRTMLVISRRSWARMRSFSLSGMGLPVKSSSARVRLGHQHGQPVGAGDAPRRPLEQQGRAAGVVDHVQHPLQGGEGRQVHRAAPLPGYMPTGVVFTRISASAWRERFS